jgi:CheY-like chemotaxis protein
MEKKILVADDSLTIQKVVELTFVDSDYRLTCVTNGRLALEKVRQDPPDVVLADVVMPEKNGYEVCEEIKKNPATSSIPVILLAGTFEPFDRERAKRLGCDAIVSKPFDSRELFRKVEELVGERSGRASVAKPEWSGAAPERSTDPVAVPPEERSVPNLFTAAPPNPFGAGFVEEDFTGSIRTLRGGRGEPLAHLYGPDDVESALAAFREVEPTSRATHESLARNLDEGADTGVVSEPEGASTDADDNRTRRIDVSDFSAPLAGERGESTVEVVADREPVEPLPPLPLGTPARHETPEAAVVAPLSHIASSSRDAGTAAGLELTDADIDRLAEKLAEKLAAKIVEKLSDRIVREVAWEVVPETAELVVRERLRELESGVE